MLIDSDSFMKGLLCRFRLSNTRLSMCTIKAIHKTHQLTRTHPLRNMLYDQVRIREFPFFLACEYM